MQIGLPVIVEPSKRTAVVGGALLGSEIHRLVRTLLLSWKQEREERKQHKQEVRENMRSHSVTMGNCGGIVHQTYFIAFPANRVIHPSLGNMSAAIASRTYILTVFSAST